MEAASIAAKDTWQKEKDEQARFSRARVILM